MLRSVDQMTTSPIPATPAGDEDVCLRCGYALQGLDADGQCPECGTPVAASRQGRLLRFSDPEYVATLHRGIVLLLVGSIMSVLLAISGGIAGIAVAFVQSSGGGVSNVTAQIVMGLQLLGSSGELLVILGWWWFSSPDPALPPAARGDRPRLVIRVALAFGVLGAVAGLGVGGIGVGPQSVTGGLWQFASAAMLGLAGLAQMVRFFAGMFYLRWMAPRIPDPLIEQRAGRYLWLLPVLVVVGSCVLVGPLIATVLQWLLLNRVRIQLRAIRAEASPPVPA
jgi:hypothetical protein